MEEKNIRYHSAFDIIGPIMVGPSSSHTAGAVRIGKVAREIFGKQPTKLSVTFYGSFAKTYRGHGTALAIVAGVLGYETNDKRIPESLAHAKENNLAVEFSVSDKTVEYANTAELVLKTNEEVLEITGVSVGGGNIEIIAINHQKISSNSLLLRAKKNVFIPLITVFSPIKVAESVQENLFLIQKKQGYSQKERQNFSEIPGILAVIPMNT